MANDETFWKEKKVLVTGADGFIGSHLTEALLDKGAETSIFIKGDSQNTFKKNRLGNLDAVQDKLSKIIKGNIGSEDCQKQIKDNDPEIIFHLAAEAYVPFSFEHPLETLKTNLIGTLNVLHAARDLKNVKQIVCTSSSEVYGTAMKDKIDEQHPLNPTSPYAASKAAADRYCYSYWKTYSLPIAIIRPFNTYGPRHTYDVIPKFIQLALENKPLTIYGDGNQSRDFTYVSDTVSGFLTMGCRKEAVGKAVNFGSGKDYTINETSKLIKELSGSSSEITHEKERPAEVNRLICDYGLAKKLFGWEPKISLEEGLRRNIEWEKQMLTKRQ